MTIIMVTTNHRTCYPGLMADILRAVQERVDGWENAITGVGTTRDKGAYTTFALGSTLVDEDLSALYEQCALARRVVELLPTHALRQGWSVETPDDAEQAHELDEYCERLGVRRSVLDAAIWARLYGAGAIFVGADDGQDPSVPLRETAVKTVRFLRVYDKTEMQPEKYDQDPLSMSYGRPVSYRIYQYNAGVAAPTNLIIHTSRLVLFRGIRTTSETRQRQNGWDSSVLQTLWKSLADYGHAWGSVLALLSDASQAVYKIQGLIEAFAAGDVDSIMARMSIIDRTRSAVRAVVLDAEKEDFLRISTPITGVPETLQEMKYRIAADVGYPMTVLFGQSPAGLNATGDSDRDEWYATITSERCDVIEPLLKRLIGILLLAKDAPQIEDWKLTWPSLRQMSPAEEAALHASQAAADKLYVDMQVVTPEEIAASRFGGDQGYSLDTHVDMVAREELLKTERIAEELEATAQPQKPMTGEVPDAPEEAATEDPEDEDAEEEKPR